MRYRLRHGRKWASVAALAVVLVSTAGCGSGGNSQIAAGPPYKNQVYTYDFPDPYVLKSGNIYYAYATTPTGGSSNIPVMRSQDLVHWTEIGDALPIRPVWEDKNSWGPTVLARGDGKYVMYYSGDDPNTFEQCLSRAVASSPAGPFHDTSNKPLMCQTKLGGDIDPDLFRDDNGSVYLYWKNDGNHNGNNTYLWAQRLTKNGMSLVGKPVRLIHNTEGWEQDVIEAPSMVKHDSKYFLFFSGHHWDSLSYSVGYAICTGPMGPCQQAKENPILKYRSGCDAEGPGGQTITTDSNGNTWILYHAWVGDATSYDPAVGGKRALWLDPLNWKNGTPSVPSPCQKEPGPAVSKSKST